LISARAGSTSLPTSLPKSFFAMSMTRFSMIAVRETGRQHTCGRPVPSWAPLIIIPSFGVPACRNRKIVMSRLIDPVVTLDFHQISRRGRAMPPAADDFATFLKAYIARWAGRAGVL
jgi:hypothetical protein